MTKKLIVAEKPSVARDIARVLGVKGQGDGFLYGSGTPSHGPSATWSPWRSRGRRTSGGRSGAWRTCPCCRTTYR
jgi:DNA topoisomerase IA